VEKLGLQFIKRNITGGKILGRNIIETSDFIVTKFNCGTRGMCYQINERNKINDQNWHSVQLTEKQLMELSLWFILMKIFNNIQEEKK